MPEMVRRLKKVGQPMPVPGATTLASADAQLVRQIDIVDSQRPLFLNVGSDRTAVFSSVAELLQDTSVFTFIKTTDDRIDEIALPFVGDVHALTDLPNGDVAICHKNCASSLVLRAGMPDRDLFLERLQQGLAFAQESPRVKETAIVQRKSTGDVIYVELVDAAPKEGCVTLNGIRSEDEVMGSLTGADTREIDRVASALDAQTCDPSALSDSCIPFTYVDSFCWVRAHVICQALADAGIQSAKVWAFATSLSGLLRVPTDCLSSCVTNWRFHVIPVVRDTAGDLRVIDPSMFRGTSVLLSEFMGLMGPEPRFVFTDTNVYQLEPGGAPGGFCTSVFREQRLQLTAGLQLMRSFEEGPPRYTSCQL